MRLGLKTAGSFVCGTPEVSSTLTLAQYLTLWETNPAEAARVRRPFTGGVEAATAALYPALAGRQPVETVVFPVTLGGYRLTLDNYGALPYWKNAVWEQKANVPDRLAFDYPADADNVQNLTRPGIIRLYGADGELVQIFRLMDLLPSVKRDNSGIMAHVTAEGMLGQLADEWVSYYGPVRQRPAQLVADYVAWRDAETRSVLDRARQLQTTFLQLDQWADGYAMTDSTHAYLQALIAQYNPAWIAYQTTDPFATINASADALMASIIAEIAAQSHTATVPEHITAIMREFQINSEIGVGPLFDPWYGGTITPTFEARSILECLTELHKLTGQSGHFAVTPANELIWLPSFGGDGTAISVGYNLKSLERHCNTAEVCTVLTVYGHGLSADTRLQATASANTDLYGCIPRQVWVDEVDSQADLNAYATALVGALSVPVVDYNVSAADLHSIGVGELITLGSYVLVKDVDLGIETQQWLVGITHRLDDPLDITFQFAKQVRDLPAIIRAINGRLDRLERRDDLGRVLSALRDGKLPGVRDGNRIDGDPRQTDLRVNNDDLEYHNGEDWESAVGNYRPIDAQDTRLDKALTDDSGAFRYVKQWSQAAFDDLPTSEADGIFDGDIAYATDKAAWYMAFGGAWFPIAGITQFARETKDALPDDTHGADDGDFGYTTGATKRGYYFIDGEWQCTTHFEATA